MTASHHPKPAAVFGEPLGGGLINLFYEGSADPKPALSSTSQANDREWVYVDDAAISRP